jgi:hypothetical protein
MIVVIWCLGVVVLALALLRQGPALASTTAPERPYPVQPLRDDAPQAAPWVARSGTGAGWRTGAALLALALGADVSAAGQTWARPAELQAAAPAQAWDSPGLGGYDLTSERLNAATRLAADDRDLIGYAPSGWMTPPVADGWFV